MALGSRAARGVRIFRWLFGLALIGAVVLVARHYAEAEEFLQLARNAAPSWFALGCAFQLCTYLCDASSWRTVLRRSGQPRALSTYLGLGVAKLFVDQAVPSGGMAGTFIVVRGLERRGIPRPVAMAAVVVDLYAFYAAYAVSVLLALAVLDAVVGVGTVVLLTAGAFVLVASTVVGLLTALTTRLGRNLPRWILKLKPVAALIDAISAAEPTLVRRVDLLARAFGFQLLIFLLDAATVWAMLRAVGQGPLAGPVFSAYIVSQLARTLGILPGGIGTFEAASVAMLHLVRVPVGAALAATLLFRGLSFWLPLAPGLWLARRETR
jgi:uncharacterized protein (TIRG00374 family)